MGDQHRLLLIYGPEHISAFSMQSSSTSATVPITNFTVTDNIGVAAYCLSLTSSSGGCGWNTVKPVNYTFSGLTVGVATRKILYAFAKDESNNVSLARGAATIITLSAAP
jgi:hypothetical protein